MKFVIILAILCLVAVSAAPQGEVQTLKDVRQVGPDGYDFEYELSDQTRRQESGKAEGEQYNVLGEYSYVSPEGRTITVTFTAGEQGFAPRVTYA